MSDAKREKAISDLQQDAQRAYARKDANALWRIAVNLEQLSAWMEARAVERLAEEVERAQSESMAWRQR